MSKRDDYIEMLESNGYINIEAILDFLKENFIADFEIVSQIYRGGMSNLDYGDLQDAIDVVRGNLEI